MTAFDRLDKIASRAVDRVMAESFTLHPIKRQPNGPAAIDHGRMRISGVGVFDQRSRPIAIQIGNRQAGSNSNDLRSTAMGQTLEFSVDLASAGPDFNPKQGDAILIRGRTYSISQVQPDGQARVVFHLEGSPT